MGLCINRKKIIFNTTKMKLIKLLLAIVFFSLITNTANAQFKDWINRKKEEAKQKVNNKIDQKTSDGIDKAIDAPEKAVKKKVDKKKNKTEQAAEQADAAVAENTNVETPADEVVIATNINCQAGKLKIEELLRDMDGVSSASVDTESGKIYLSAGGDKKIYDAAIELICKNGFKADGKKATTKANACK
jgi:hypothetical protein